MKVSFNWLNQYIDIQDYRARLPELENLLTQAGLEVEEMVNPSENWGHVVVGELLEVGSHPDADKLTLCQVNVGKSEPLQIVCGAKNHKQGDFVAVQPAPQLVQVERACRRRRSVLHRRRFRPACRVTCWNVAPTSRRRSVRWRR